MRLVTFLLVFSLLISGCAAGARPSQSTMTPAAPASTSTLPPTATYTVQAPTETAAPTVTIPAETPTAPPTAAPTETPLPIVTATANTPAAGVAAQVAQTGADGVPAFDHIILIVLENHDYAQVVGSEDMPNFNRLAQENVLLTQYYAVAHPSLPNYLALIGGSTFGITTDCFSCFLDQPSLPDLLEASGRTWKTYQESMTAPCSLGIEPGGYDQNHNPFVYFNPIRKDTARCARSVVSLDQLDADLSAGSLPNFALIMPNLCNSGHDCGLATVDQWLGKMVDDLRASPALGQNSLIVITFDEASSDSRGCCGLPQKAGGRIPAVLISPLAKSGFQDDTPLSHYSLLKTMLFAWNLPGLGETENPATQPITAPWK